MHCQCSAIRIVVQAKHFSGSGLVGLLKVQPQVSSAGRSLPNRGL